MQFLTKKTLSRRETDELHRLRQSYDAMRFEASNFLAHGWRQMEYFSRNAAVIRKHIDEVKRGVPCNRLATSEALYKQLRTEIALTFPDTITAEPAKLAEKIGETTEIVIDPDSALAARLAAFWSERRSAA